MKRIAIAAGLSFGLIQPAIALSHDVTGRHFGVYRYVYRHAVKQFGHKAVGCELVYTCHASVTDDVVISSTRTLERMLHPVPTFAATASVPAPTLGYGNWAIPAKIVYCESKYLNLPPNSAGASGYYQIIPSTWIAYGGGRYASQAYLASKSAQDTIAAKIWDGGNGASQWTCTGIVGYSG